MEKPNYFKAWGDAWPVVILIVLCGVGAGLVSGLIAVAFGLLIEVTGLVEGGEPSYRWAFYVWCVAMIVTLPVQLNSALKNFYRDRIREEDRADAAERERIDAENAAALASGGEAALAKLRNDRWLAEQKPRAAARR